MQIEDKNIVKILRSHGIQVTRQRVAVLKMMVCQQDIIPVSVINKHFSGLLNRVTVYRVLRDFEKKSLIVKVANPGGDPRYILALPKKDKPGTRKRQRVFFMCTECGNTTVL
jgi:Fe2+ or Zn2+ uptake regulation protein